MEPAIIIAILSFVGSVLTVIVSLLTTDDQRKKLQAEAESLAQQAATAAKQVDMDHAMRLIDQLQDDNERLRINQKQRDEDYEKIYKRQRELQTQYDHLQAQYDQLQTQYDHLEAGVQILIKQVCDMGEVPNWAPQTMLGEG